MDERANLQRVVRVLAAYLRSHPHANDTAEGMARWWFDSEQDVLMDNLQKALDCMVNISLIEEVTAADGRRRYRRIASDAQLDALLAAPPAPQV